MSLKIKRALMIWMATLLVSVFLGGICHAQAPKVIATYDRANVDQIRDFLTVLASFPA